MERFPPDLLILDRTLPDADGLELCKQIRAHPRLKALPVLFLTAKGSVTDRVVGFAAGADDYLPKPFSAQELVARVSALLRRTRPQEKGAVLRSGELELDVDTRTASAAGKALTLTPKEFDMLQAFLASGGKVLTRRYLLERVWGYEQSVEMETRVVDSTVSHLRGKLGPSGRRIAGVLYYGYRLEEPC